MDVAEDDADVVDDDAEDEDELIAVEPAAFGCAVLGVTCIKSLINSNKYPKEQALL